VVFRFGEKVVSEEDADDLFLGEDVLLRDGAGSWGEMESRAVRKLEVLSNAAAGGGGGLAL
jgi:hypothetical protein